MSNYLGLLLVCAVLSASLHRSDAFSAHRYGSSAGGLISRKYLPALNAGGDVQFDIKELQESLFGEIDQVLGLKRTDYTDFEDVTNWSSGALGGSTDWYDEQSGAKLTGVSKYSYGSAIGSSCSIDGWVGPSRAVPHMLLSVLHSSETGSFGIISDYVPRGPTPIGNDQRYLDLYYNDEVIWGRYQNVANVPTAVHLPPPLCFSGRLLRSPLHLAVTGLSFSEVADAATGHVQQWLDWVLDGEEVQARMRGSMNMRDDRLREFAYRAALNRYSDLLQREGDGNADLARRIAAGSTGPLAEAYVGGGS